MAHAAGAGRFHELLMGGADACRGFFTAKGAAVKSEIAPKATALGAARGCMWFILSREHLG
jgi:hypothetical protein